jgi:23S rRNA pseudouridine955/2504/2580 synthase
MNAVSSRKVASSEEGMRLDRWFHLHYPEFSHGQLEKCLRKGQIRVDGGRIAASFRLASGQTVRIPPLPEKREALPEKPPAAPTREDEDFVRSLVIYKDEDFIALNKPSGLAVQGGSKQERHLDALLDALRFEAEDRPRLVHRLDKDTSGVLLLARSRESAALIGKVLKQRTATKIYWALVNGVPRPQEGTINLSLAKSAAPDGERVRVVEQDDDDGQRAVSKFKVVATAGTKLAFVLLSPETGRTHQLRVHMAAIGHTIVGDGKYGGGEAHPGGEIPRKLHLHARSFAFDHPVTGKRIEIRAPLPEHMARTWELLGFDTDRDENPFIARKPRGAR